MLRTQDFMLTFAAICLLLASLEVKSRTIKASASELGAEHQVAGRRSDANIDVLMYKIKRNLESGNKGDPQAVVTATKVNKSPHMRNQESDKNHNSYNYYANETSALSSKQQHSSDIPQRAKPEAQEGAQEVPVDFLRSSNDFLTQRQPNTTTYLYLLSNTNQQPPALDQSNEIDVGEQQQQPPFTMMPPYNQQQQQQSNPLANPNIRQILNNYQRYPQAAAQLQNNPHYQRLAAQALANGDLQNNPLLRSLLQQAQAGQQQQQQPQPLPPQRPPQQLLEPAQQLPQAQQPFSPLQLITAPFQAFLPALAGVNNQQGAAVATDQKERSKSNSEVASNKQPVGEAQPHQQQQQPLSPISGLLNPFAPAPGQAQPQVNGLQALYQQLPLYQALLAARQRQEALQAAEKLRQQQQQAYLQNNAIAQLPTQRPPYIPQPPFGFGQPPLAPQITQTTAQPAPVNNQQNPSPVQFDDDEAPANQPNQNEQQPHDNNANNQQDQTNEQQQPHDNVDSQGPAQNNNDQPADNDSNNDQGAGNNAAGPNEQRQPEEEDPDLKQFQNLANGGDSFTDLFPPGILSNNDISDIKKQQEEQAKKQEEEERQRQLQQQLQANRQQQQQDQPQTQDNNGPENNGPANNSEEGRPEEGEQEEGAGDDDGQDGGGEGEQDNPTAAALTSKSSDSQKQTDKTIANSKKFTQSPGVEYN